jgi:predicted HTH transcriptional regulator
MKHQDSYSDEFDQLTGEISDVVEDIPDPVVVGKLLYNIASEKKSYNLDRIATLLEKMSEKKEVVVTERRAENIEISDRDKEILDFVKARKRVCADDVQDRFQYKGRNAASARLHRLYKDKVLEKVHAGRNVYYTVRNQEQPA